MKETILATFLNSININNFELGKIEDDNYTTILRTEIDPSTTGALAPIFTKISLRIDGIHFTYHNITRINFHYSYEHPSGSNGYEAIYYIIGEKIYSQDEYLKMKHSGN